MIKNGFSKLIIVESWKGNPGNILFYDISEGYLKPTLLIRVVGSTLQVDVKRNTMVSELDIEFDEDVGDLGYEIMRFLDVPLIDPRRGGVKGILNLSRREGYIEITFLNEDRRPIYPRFKVNLWKHLGK